MKKNIVLAFALLGTIGAYAQTGIGTVLPNGTSMLDVASTTKGVLIPRVDLTSDTDIVTIKGGDYPESLIVYHNGKTGPLAGFYYWEKKKWNVLVSNTNLYEYIKKEAKQDTVLITQDNGDYIFTWKDDKGVPQTMRISEVIKKFETLTEFKGALDGTNEAVLTYKPERGAVSTVKLTELLKSSSVFEAYIKTLVGPGAGKTVVAKGTGIAVGESTAGTTTTYTVSAVPGEIILNGNVNGPLNASKVIGIQNVPVSATTPTAGQSLVYNQTASTWEPGKPAVSTGDITGKANLTTDGVIVVGDAATGTNTAANAVLAATTLSIKNASITGGKIATNTLNVNHLAVVGASNFNSVLSTDTKGTPQWFVKNNLTTDNIIVVGKSDSGANVSGNFPLLAPMELSIRNGSITGTQIAANAINGGTHIINNSVPWTKMINGTINSILTTSNNGSLEWQPKSAFTTTGATLTTAGGIIVGTTGAANTAAGAVLTAVTISIQDGGVTGAKIAANAVGSGHIADNAVIGTKIAANAINGNTHIINNSIPWGKMNNGNPSTILTTTAAGLLQWEPRATFITPKANLTTDGVIVIGDPAGAANTSAGAVMLATQLSIKNASITGAKIAANAVGSGHIADNAVIGTKIAANAINGSTHIINSSIPWGKMNNGNPSTILTTTAAGLLQWEPRATFIAPVITANNGLTKAGNNIELGGILTKTVSINTGAFSFGIAGLTRVVSTPSATTNVLLVEATGELKQARAANPGYFYLPPVNIVITPGAANQSLNLHTLYSTQYKSPRAKSDNSLSLPVYAATELNYYVIYADPAVFSSIAVNTSGVITYSINANPTVTGNTFITVVLQVK